jgi:hypothetical protein
MNRKIQYFFLSPKVRSYPCRQDSNLKQLDYYFNKTIQFKIIILNSNNIIVYTLFKEDKMSNNYFLDYLVEDCFTLEKLKKTHEKD